MSDQSTLARLGHGSASTAPTASGRRWVGRCECGYQSTTRRTERDALGAVVHHARGVLAAWINAGRPPTLIEGRAPMA